MQETPQNWRKYLQPRLLLFIWGGIGALWLVWVLIAAMIPPQTGMQNTATGVSFSKLLQGELAEFTTAFPPRQATSAGFEGPEGELSLGDFRGKVVLVNLWATWCAPCVEELPSLDRLQNELGKTNFEVIALAVGPQGQMPIDQFFTKHNINHLVIYKDQDLDFSRTLGNTDALPMSILYDTNGTEIGRIIGAVNWTSADAKRLIQAVLEGQKP